MKPVLCGMAMLLAASLACDQSKMGATRTGGADAGTGGTTTPPIGPGGDAAGGGGSTGSAGATGSGGTPGPVVVPADISGRWAMFNSEDPVGVELSVGTDGTLIGRGCLAGTPGATNAEPGLTPVGCGNISGKVIGQTATFGFKDETFSFFYFARVTISADAQRMTGQTSNSNGDLAYPLGWLRVPADAVGLIRTPPATEQPLYGWYELTLVDSANTGSEFVPGKAYTVWYGRSGLTGDLGSFWSGEMSEPSGGQLRIGPVPATVPALPTSMALEFVDSSFVRVTASTPSGGVYTFAAKKVSP